MRALGKAIILGLAMAVTPILGCSSNEKHDTATDKRENTGDLGLELRVGDLNVNSVHYVLTNGTNSYSGDINVADAGTFTAVIGGVQQGSGYTLSLTASATDDAGTPCLGNAGPFTVAANQSVTVGIELRCTKARTQGSVLIDGTVNLCPQINSVFGDAPNGCNVPLHVAAVDDGLPVPPGMLTYTWTGAPGLTGANPVLNCQSSGLIPLNLVVSDGDTKPGCDAPFAVTVRCPAGCPLVAPTCTDGIQNQGESAVDCGGTSPCPRCTAGRTCGVNSDCASPLSCVGGICATAPTCTDGIQNQGETGIDCGGPCPACVVPVCTAPLHDSAATCLPCEANNCPNDPTGCAAGMCVGQPSCDDYPVVADRNLCKAVLDCARRSNCHAGGSLACFCGTADATQCAATTAPNANGVCKAEIQAGLKSMDPAFIRGNLLNVGLPGGGALNLLQCDRDFCGATGANACLPYCK